jgi:uncharacterized membrane protein YeiB
MGDSPDSTEKPSALLLAIKSPLIFNAFAILVMGFLIWRPATLQPTPRIVWIGIGFIVAVTIWSNIFAKLWPRELVYGPHELLRESQLSYDLKMAKATNPKT